MELEAAMTDRLIDVKTQVNMLTMKRKCLWDERAQMKMDVADRLLKIEQLKKRYALSMDLLGKNDDGSTVTAVQIKIQMAQEKYLLLNQGNALNGTIVKAESEIKCMENTLKLMNFSNDEYRKIFETVTESSPEVKRMNDLQNQYCQTMNDIRTLKSNLMALVDHLELMETQRVELVKEFEEVQRKKLDNNDALLKVHKELVDQETKLERADRDMKIAFKGAKRRIKDQEFICLFEKDMMLRERDERNNSSLQQVADLVEVFPDMGQTVTRHFLERGLSLPANARRAKSQCSWKSETSLGDPRTDVHCMNRCKFFHLVFPINDKKKFPTNFIFITDSHRSILSGSSTSSSNDTKSSSKDSVKMVTQHPSGLSVVKITFPETKKPKMKSQKAAVTKN